MTFPGLPLFADQLTRTTFRLGRIESNADWILPIGLCMVVLFIVYTIYRRDAQELGKPWGWALVALRCATFLGLLALYFQPEWRRQREVMRNSRALLLVDTSLSMGLVDMGTSTTAPGAPSRARQVAAALADSSLLDDLRTTHDVVVLGFDQETRRLVSMEKHAASDRDSPGLTDPPNVAAAGTIDWENTISPRGLETRLGQALRQTVREARALPVAGVVVFSDGRQNAGVGAEAAIDAAREARIPVFTVGLGSDRLPPNVAVYKLEAAPRVYPGDPMAVTGLFRSQGLAGETVTADLLVRSAEQTEPGTGTPVGSEQIVLGGDGETVPVKFEYASSETGPKTLCLRIQPHGDDRNPNDDYREVDVEIVDRKDRVLLFAGGPTREYRFLRSLLYRDDYATVDVLLQTAQPGISQEADQILDDFPSIREEMSGYDCLVAIDPDWNRLTDAQIQLLESWVGEQAGGLVVVAGRVYAGQAILGWVESDRTQKVRDLYPVELPRNVPLAPAAEERSRDPWPMEFTREGMEAEYLWLDDTGTANQEAWAGFPGIFSCFPAWRAKPAAVVLATFSDPRAGRAGQQPVLMAEQFYGSGRVFYVGSGEIWRLRSVDETYFERFYTGLVRHVSQGRLLRQSTRATLLVGQQRCAMGSTVPIRAQLADARLEPLDLPGVELQVTRPDTSRDTITLRPDPDRIGTYLGQLTVLAEGAFRLELPVPDSDDERVVRRIQVTVPDRERENPKRNDELLARIAAGAGGKYYADLPGAIDPNQPDALVNQLRDRTETVIFTSATDPLWEEQWLRWLMIILCSLLCLEWLIRRLLRLA